MPGNNVHYLGILIRRSSLRTDIEVTFVNYACTFWLGEEETGREPQNVIDAEMCDDFWNARITAFKTGCDNVYKLPRTTPDNCFNNGWTILDMSC